MFIFYAENNKKCLKIVNTIPSLPCKRYEKLKRNWIKPISKKTESRSYNKTNGRNNGIFPN